MASQVVQQGMDQQTPAAKQIIRSGMFRGKTQSAARGRAAGRAAYKRVARKTRKAAAKKSKARKKLGRAILKKGSAAAKAWGRKMLAARKRR